MKPFLENSNIEELEAIQRYMDEHGIEDPERLTEKDYENIQESKSVRDQKDTLKSYMVKSYTHMLKYRYQCAEQKVGWLSTISRAGSYASSMPAARVKEEDSDTEIEAIYQDALKDKDLYQDTGMTKEDFPKTAKEAFGECRKPSNMKDWKYMKDHFIDKYAIHDKKAEMEEGWDRYKDNYNNK